MNLGFARVGFASGEPFAAARPRLETWLSAGFHGEMTYLAGQDDRCAPEALLPGIKTIVCVALPYGGIPVALRRSRHEAEPLVGSVARYAVGNDYHRVLKDKLVALADACSRIVGRSVQSRACVDTAPLLEREAAARAGIGFIGKSTLVIAPGLGTYFLLGELLLDVDMEVDTDSSRSPLGPEASPVASSVAGGCGRCTACLDACPTGAFVGPYVLDARRCISYLTIENKGAIQRELRPLIGTRVFGCDVCQDVCPFNASGSPRPAAPELAPRASLDAPELESLLELGAAAYRKLVRRSALRRVGKHQLQRNAAVALGNTGDPRAIPPLLRSLAREPNSLVRAHVAWALGQVARLGGPDVRAALETARAMDASPEVREEAQLALARLS
jgi:epoxyqueuosine reductase